MMHLSDIVMTSAIEIAGDGDVSPSVGGLASPYDDIANRPFHNQASDSTSSTKTDNATIDIITANGHQKWKMTIGKKQQQRLRGGKKRRTGQSKSCKDPPQHRHRHHYGHGRPITKSKSLARKDRIIVHSGSAPRASNFPDHHPHHRARASPKSLLSASNDDNNSQPSFRYHGKMWIRSIRQFAGVTLARARLMSISHRWPPEQRRADDHDEDFFGASADPLCFCDYFASESSSLSSVGGHRVSSVVQSPTSPDDNDDGMLSSYPSSHLDSCGWRLPGRSGGGPESGTSPRRIIFGESGKPISKSHYHLGTFQVRRRPRDGCR